MPNQHTPHTEITVQVHPRSGKNRLVFVADVLHAWVTAPPVEGAANDAVIALLAQAAGVPKRNVTLAHGATSRHKRFIIDGVTQEELRAKIGGERDDG